MTLGQETRWAYSTTLLRPHGAVSPSTAVHLCILSKYDGRIIRRDKDVETQTTLTVVSRLFQQFKVESLQLFNITQLPRFERRRQRNLTQEISAQLAVTDTHMYTVQKLNFTILNTRWNRELEETTRTPSYYVDEDYPAGPEIQQPLPGWSNWRGSESSTLETETMFGATHD